MSETTTTDKGHACRVRLPAGWTARHLHQAIKTSGAIKVRRARLTASTVRGRRFIHRVDVTSGPPTRPRFEAAHGARESVGEALRRDEGVPSVARFPPPS